MPAVCLVSTDTDIAPLVAAIPESYSVYAIAAEELVPVGGRVTPVGDFDELPDNTILVAFCDPYAEESEDLAAEVDNLTNALFIVNATGSTATRFAQSTLEDQSVAAFTYVPSMFEANPVLEISTAIQLSPAQAGQAVAQMRLAFPGKQIEVVQDRVGHIALRTLAMVINEAAFAVMEGVATPAEIDTAMKLGTGYPTGPLEWCDRISAYTVVNLLDALNDDYRDERYRACILLRQMARAGRKFYDEEVGSRQ